MPHKLAIGQGAAARTLSVLTREGEAPAVVWLPGFRSEMRSIKGEALDRWAAARGRALVRFDYTAHGESGGAFEEATVSLWLEDTMAVLDRFVPGRPILVGSSMGGWLALLATRELLRTRPERSPAGLVLIAPAVDFTERLMWERLPDSIRRALLAKGVYELPSVYSEIPYPITRKLIEDGRRHLLFGTPIATGCPVHILQGMRDPDVPWTHAMQLVEHLPGDSVTLTLVKDGDHRLSRPEDLERLTAAIEALGAPRASSGGA
ncbi:MAG TPA: alpha/beta hydrolase [Microvirga sp.]|nr:alpha/beta hydrolase [Microvirga sp.]